MERMTPDTDKREGLGEGIYAKFVQNYEKLLEENKKLKKRVEELEKEKSRDGLLGQATMEEAYNRIIELEEENKKLKEEKEFFYKSAKQFREENEKLNEKIRFLEECLDNKEKVNKSLREELEKIKSTYVYDAKQVRDIC